MSILWAYNRRKEIYNIHNDGASLLITGEIFKKHLMAWISRWLCALSYLGAFENCTFSALQNFKLGHNLVFRNHGEVSDIPHTFLLEDPASDRDMYTGVTSATLHFSLTDIFSSLVTTNIGSSGRRKITNEGWETTLLRDFVDGQDQVFCRCESESTTEKPD